LSAYTDSRGNANYNVLLSQRRAESAVEYIVKQGINKNRLKAKGFGAQDLLNRCAVGIKCSEVEHQVNRRTEFILKSKGSALN
jgi:peptidoglycan-associated lipoprotein